MKLFSTVVAATALGFLMMLILGCASSSNLVNVWHDPSYQAPPLGKVLVISVRKDATMRRIWEDAFTTELAKHGVVSTSSYGLFPDAPPDTNQVIATVQANGFNAILVILRLPSETDRQYVQGYTTTEQVMHFSTYWQRYITYYQDIDHPGYVDSQAVAVREIDLTTTGNNGKLIWSATSRTPDPGSVPDLQRGVAGLATSELTKRGIIGSKK